MNKIGIDIGATNTRVGLVINDNVVEVEVFSSIVDNLDKELEQIKAIVDKMEVKFGKITSIGLACPGPLDLKQGIIMDAPNLPGWRFKPIVSEFQKVFPDKTIKLDNDANVAAFGQYLEMPKKPYSLFYVTVSSGVGSGFVNQGKIFHGYTGIATEIFNALPEWQNGEDPSKSGIEYFCSGINICRVLKSRGLEVKNSKEAFALKDTNAIAKNYFQEYKKRFAALLATAVYFYNPEYIVLGGSVALNNEDFFKEIFELTLSIIKNVDHRVTFKFAENLESATLLGASDL